jgi:hypothetical protein
VGHDFWRSLGAASSQEALTVTPEEFRRIALDLPEATEGAHMGHPDFRVRGKIFATLFWPDGAWGVVILTPEEQDMLVRTKPAVFEPVAGGWGRRGSTKVRLQAIDESSLRIALTAAWRKVAPKSLAKRLEGSNS